MGEGAGISSVSPCGVVGDGSGEEMILRLKAIRDRRSVLSERIMRISLSFEIWTVGADFSCILVLYARRFLKLET